jgi:hypothetical protein
VRLVTGALLSLSVLLVACQSGRAPGDEKRPTTGVAQPANPQRNGSRPIFVRGPTNGNPVAPFVAHEVAEAQKGHWNVLVYVGATWCEPCQRFHAAATAGEFDEILPGAHIVEFDLDADKDALAAAGYSSKLIPLFCVPKVDGTASDRRIEGSIKGTEAVGQNLIPRLRAFLAGS